LYNSLAFEVYTVEALPLVAFANMGNRLLAVEVSFDKATPSALFCQVGADAPFEVRTCPDVPAAVMA
jgi:hypothetical protein